MLLNEVLPDPFRAGNYWHFADGSVLPVVSGAEDGDPDPDDGNTITLPPETPPPTQRRQSRQPRTFTEEEVERIRQEEKDKLYSRLGKVDDLETQLAELTRERDERKKAEAKAQRDADAARKKAEEEEMSAKQLIESKEKEWQSKFEVEQQERRKIEILMEKEREFAGLQVYLNQRMLQEQEYIMPELQDLVAGNSKEEIDASIEQMKQRTAQIMGHVEARFTGQRAAMPGVAPTGGPPVGPVEGQQSFQTMSLDDLKNLPMDQYQQLRPRLMEAQRNMRQGR